MRPRKTKTQLKKKDLLTLSELSDLTGVRQTTIFHYTRIGLLKYIQKAPGRIKRLPREQSLKRLAEIAKMKRQGKNMEEIIRELWASKT